MFEFVKSLKSKAFKLNLYVRCVANKIVKGKQITICFHVDDCKISHEVPQVIDETIDWLKAEYESIFENVLENYRNPLFLVRGDSRESSERPTSLCVVCRCNHYPLVGGVPARLIL